MFRFNTIVVLLSLIEFFFIYTKSTETINVSGVLIKKKASITGEKIHDYEIVENLKEEPTNEKDYAAICSFYDTYNKTGWYIQSVKTNEAVHDYIQAYFAGVLEYRSMEKQISIHYENIIGVICEKKKCKRLKKYLQKNLDYMLMSSKFEAANSPYWHQIRLLLWQLKGFHDSEINKVKKNSTEFDLTENEEFQNMKYHVIGKYLLHLTGDLPDLMAALYGESSKITKSFKEKSPSCSALIKRTLDGNIIVAHDTWSHYSTMIRVIKNYDFNWRTMNSSDSFIIPGAKMLFTSYPGAIGSIDDFYVLGTEMVATETTYGNLNSSLWKFIVDDDGKFVLEIFRSLVANRLALNGEDWAKYYVQENSGTYINQWMIVDTKKNGESNLLRVVETLPKYHEDFDATSTLEEMKYYASYNLPSSLTIQERGGFKREEKKHGSVYSYEKCPRKQIFARDHEHVTDLKSMYDQMRYNEFTKDPLSRCDCKPAFSGEFAIAARSDLNYPDGEYPLDGLKFRLHGATDTKVVDLKMVKKMSLIAINSPTYESLPPFRWSEVPNGYEKPRLHPDIFKFSPYRFTVGKKMINYVKEFDKKI